ncbi:MULTISPECIES: aromatic ring-hydroxylating dioxygenase subunit alpha [Protofrankia]|uniref:(2Fe-2S)-binding protein n=1 Tax=Protofrankia coriariae TaxID=1562887 RepID=A0ABR5F6I9_9ACTN|nr:MULTISPECIES: aromatic ring-hydroxylating dioxygenase subunit alpha [Protofrankia]KLL12344.1 (2Fe-2S)-binding protein [Protofrankia coriariae]ONH37350.1 (2Fe-2S)-binding protein [Protofrankia sp. BMG5.30]
MTQSIPATKLAPTEPAPTEPAQDEPAQDEPQYPLAPSAVDASVYTDQARYQGELDRILSHAWFPVFPSADVPKPRDYVVWNQLGQSVVIIRLDDGSVSAWHNVCQHRGALLVEGSGRCSNGRFTCPWHGFVYDLEGSVRQVPLRESFDPAQLAGLRAPAVRVVEWSGWIWLTLSDTLPDLLEYLDTIGEELAGYRLDRFDTRFRVSVTLTANWKIVVDAFNETWHVPFTHKSTLSGLVLWRDASLKISSPHSWMTLPIRGFTDKVSNSDHRQTHLCHYLAFPNTIFSCFPNHLQMWTAWPVAPDKTVLNAYQLVGPTPDGLSDAKWEQHNERDWKHFLDVLAEDSEVINNFAALARSKGFRRNIFNTAESRLTAFHDEVAKRLR